MRRLINHNAAYGDDLSYEAEINYNNTEIINTKGFSSTYMTFHADMFITAVEGDKILEYAIEFQTKFDEEILIRMFRYSFERAAKLAYFKDKNKLRLKLPEPYLIMLEKEKGMDNEIMLEIEIPKALLINFKVKVLKSYLLNKYELKDDVDKEVKIMFKGFYDPKIEAIGVEKGIEKGIKLVAENMIKDGNPIEKIKMYTGLNEEQIDELKRLIETKGEH